ncbi:leucine-rich_repeat domain-containing protein [Hexamita inflata]|uniref:Leucine-rich repeat domain-containing protein n=1 Tax=Hexamita inflata TaxID=28002 RepID=A0AA86R5J6_9EUKA|nr:leucine-rich repeat domain-containing protein [Hexamita inflata]CAI9966558.1 leucine-rich repeat domain-containing protein [Hexamita inflata]CAI9966560.1 leucine-rich repeat domain-containing protein [Hexamita inflata]
MSQLDILELRYCSVQKIDSIMYLINLKELSLEGNKNIDITPIQYLTQLIILNLNNCDIHNIDAINSLVNLEQLSLESNKIVYIQSLQSLNKLLNLNVYKNQIKDIQPIKKHINFNKFMLGNQSTPEHLEVVFANKMRDIQAPIYSLKKIKSQRIKILGQKQKLVDEIFYRFLALQYSQISFSTNIASIFEQLNSFETYQ